MSRQTTRSANDSTPKSRQTTISYHPVWMARWTRSSTNTSAEKYELDKGKAKVSPLIDKPFIVSNNQSPYAEYNGEKMEGRSLNACLSDFNTSLLFDRDWFKKMQQVSGIRFLSTPSVEDKSNNTSFSGCDMETMRICTTAINGESSSEAYTMGMNFLKEKNVDSGAHSTPSTKAFNIISNSSPPLVIDASRKTERHSTKTTLPNTNLELPALPAVETSPENLCPSSSRAQSLETGMLTQTKPNINPDDPNPSNRWAKRIKPSSPNSSPRGTKITNPTENLSHDKMRKHFKSIPISSLTSSEQSPRNNKHHGKETNISESLFSHVWIKRWLREWSRVMEEKSDPTVGKVCGSRELKSSLDDDDDDDLEKKQFPSIGAMALMRKAMGGFQSCEIQKRGSIAVWNTKGTF